MNIDNKSTLVDVRTPGECATKHVSGAINIPLDEIANRIDELKHLPKPIVAYCRSGNRSGIAAAILRQHGIVDVVNGGSLDEMLAATA